MPPEKKAKPFRERHIVVRFFALCVSIVIGYFIVSGGLSVFRYFKNEDRLLYERKKNARHVPIDKIGTKTIYIEIYKNDTVGVFID